MTQLELPVAAAPMYGRDTLVDSDCSRDYDPWEHAVSLGLPVIYRSDVPEDSNARYSLEHRAVFVRPGLHAAVERSTIAHEIVHHEHDDEGCETMQEERADRIAAGRLIRPSLLWRYEGVTEDPGAIALELGVTDHLMLAYLRWHARR
ncbi:hypothetical protein GCM10022198_14880 [Klugiella xanthotipulae]|uniref:Uncharacterized protein DUF955 n=1 Tax=Klugiella xanthotipulae TaxID=244735 RepID=A0A543I6V0_9MICO|nr:ImmA/IrrE family metallo-endopeptidase [Klugiella xanthotipulae]TQM66220.1 uncharacterized protein DUF955 [Klugiella xanthotipulae]